MAVWWRSDRPGRAGRTDGIVFLLCCGPTREGITLRVQCPRDALTVARTDLLDALQLTASLACALTSYHTRSYGVGARQGVPRRAVDPTYPGGLARSSSGRDDPWRRSSAGENRVVPDRLLSIRSGIRP